MKPLAEFLNPLVALKLIAASTKPCVQCGRPHECRAVMRDGRTRAIEGVSWADPVDGHDFQPISEADYAKAVLDHVMTDDEMLNSILATGAMLMHLRNQDGVTRCDPVMVDDQCTNQLEVEVEFLKSPYRITVEMLPRFNSD